MFSAKLKIGLAAALLAVAGMVAVAPWFQVVESQYTDLHGNTVTGTSYGLMQTCTTANQFKAIVGTLTDGVEDNGVQLKKKCTDNWAFDQTITNRVGDTASKLKNKFDSMTGKATPVTDDTEQLRYMGWAAIGLYIAGAVVLLVTAIMCLFEKTLLKTAYTTLFGWLLTTGAFLMTVFAMHGRSSLVDVHNTGTSLFTLGNKTYMPGPSGILSIVAITLSTVMMVAMFVVRFRVMARPAMKDVRYI